MSLALPGQDLHLLPLGGTGEIGMNLNAYHHQGRWLLVDCGVMFEREDAHRQHVLYPDASFLAERRDALVGLVITHAHQDHLGAVRDLWPQLRCPVYGTRFAIEMLRGPLQEAGLSDAVPLRVIGERDQLRLGPFSLQRVPLTHSTVEMGGLVIRTSAGTVLHTGDWKLDPDPRVGRTTDEEALKALAEEEVHAVVSDSTNAMVEGWTPSEGSLVAPLTDLISGLTGRVAVTLFSSNVARVRTLAEVARHTGRELLLMGRSLRRTIEAAVTAGYLTDLPTLVDPRDYGYLPPERVLLLCTGSQGESRAALTRLAEDRMRGIYLDPGDAVIYSSRRIPGCELPIDRVRRLLRERGVQIIDDADHHVHVSGHPRRDELRALYGWVQPRAVVPVHGTPAHLDAHADLAEELGLAAGRIRNGHVLRIGAQVEVIASVPTGRLRRVEEPRHRRPVREKWRSRHRRR